ncbi:hypothetical protein HYV49_02775 [Candidatus Pacearchaeota archaeon]|nr:hypothetical protein [Candidatus Pacearchaeota archaeon]
MKLNYLTDKKDEVTFEADNPTVCELLRVYLNNEDDVKMAAWKKEHPTKNPIMTLITNGKDAKKLLKETAKKIEKDLDKIEKEFKAEK